MSSDPAKPADPAADATDYGRELIRPTALRRLKWRLETAGYVTMDALLGLVPLPWVAGFGRLAGGLAWMILAKRRRVVARNLRIAFSGERTPDELRALTREVFRRSGANLLSALRTANMGERSLARALTIRDEVVFREAVGRGKGVVVVLAHMGNWEALAQWFPKLLPPGTPGATVYRPLNNPIMNARVVAARARRGVSLFSKDDNPLGMAAFMRRGGVLGVLADQRAGTIGDGRWEMGFHAMEPGEPTTAGVMRLLERMMRVSPADVFWLQDRWKIRRGQPHVLPGKPARSGAVAPTTRRRALVWVSGAQGMPVLPRANPDDVDYEVVLGSDAPEPKDAAAGGRTVHRQGGESCAEFLRRVDEAHGQPLEYVVGTSAAPAELRKAVRSLGLGWVLAKEAKP